jgi:plasmid stability protein
MSDILVRDVPDDVLRALDARAARLGISRSEYVRRRLAQDATSALVTIGVDDLTSFADAFADLADPTVMAEAWE